jgi:hypothetical protein
MSDPAQELMELSMETRQLSAYIGKLKDDKTMVTDEADRNRLAEEIKMRQFQVLFYMEKIMVPPFLSRASPVNVVANIYQADDKG